MSASIYQEHTKEILERLFSPELVEKEWSIWKDAKDRWRNRQSYAPRLDIAVGPFNLTSENRHRDTTAIRGFERHPVISHLIEIGREQNNGDFNYNINPRCLLAIEIEFSGSSKHILGNFTNASMMGLIGLVIGPVEKYAKISRVGDYFRTVRELEKAPPELFSNTVHMECEEFSELLQSYL